MIPKTVRLSVTRAVVTFLSWQLPDATFGHG